MTGPPEHANAPDRVDELLEAIENEEPPYRIGFRRGDEHAEADVDEIVKRGATTAELHLSNGRTVTVDTETELEGLR